MKNPFPDFELVEETHLGTTKPVFRSGSGPGVVVISEIPGITPQVADFARRVVALGCTVTMPSLFGTPGAPLSTKAVLGSLVPACVSSEFVCLARGTTSPVTEWLREHARALHDDVGGPGVGVIGMCFTGGFALAMMVDPVVVAPVLSQPSLPFPVSRRHRRDLGISDRDLEIVKERAAGGCDVLGLRFTGDTMVPGARFQRLRDELGDHFIAVEIDSSAGNPHGIPKSAHSVVTNDLTDEPGHPTRDALDTVLGFFRERLHVDR